MGGGVRSKGSSPTDDFRLCIAIIRRGNAPLADFTLRLIKGQPARPPLTVMVQADIGTSGRVQLILRQRGAGLKVQIELQAVDVDGIPRDSGAAIASWHFIDIDGEHLWELSDCFVLNLYPLPDAP